MNGLTQTVASDLPEDSEILELTDNENPLKFLNSSEEHLPLAVIAGIDDTDRLEGYRLAEQRYFDPPRTVILEALDTRERELTGEPSPPETSSSVPATDGGTVPEFTSEPEGSDGPDDLHPETKGLAAGEVLILETADRTEFIFPATPAAESPFLMRAFDGDDERIDEPIGLSFDEVLKRIDGEDPRPVAEIDVRPPNLAASNGGDA